MLLLITFVFLYLYILRDINSICRRCILRPPDNQVVASNIDYTSTKNRRKSYIFE